jgi:hypothetical protein
MSSSDLDSPLAMPFGNLPICSGCNHPISNLLAYVGRVGSEMYHQECIKLRHPDGCFYCPTKIGVFDQCYIWYNTQVCVYCVLNIEKTAPMIPKMVNIGGLPSPTWPVADDLLGSPRSLGLDSPTFDFTGSPLQMKFLGNDQLELSPLMPVPSHMTKHDCEEFKAFLGEPYELDLEPHELDLKCYEEMPMFNNPIPSAELLQSGTSLSDFLLDDQTQVPAMDMSAKAIAKDIVVRPITPFNPRWSTITYKKRSDYFKMLAAIPQVPYCGPTGGSNDPAFHNPPNPMKRKRQDDGSNTH